MARDLKIDIWGLKLSEYIRGYGLEGLGCLEALGLRAWVV